jgi:adenine-specific DNA glycosylase
VRPAKVQVPTVHMLAAVITHGNHVLLGRHEPAGLFGGLWDPPLFDAPPAAASRKWLLAHASCGTAQGKHVELPAPVATVRHVLTHRVLHVQVIQVAAHHRSEGCTTPPGYEALCWVAVREAGLRGTSSLARRVLAAASDAMQR